MLLLLVMSSAVTSTVGALPPLLESAHLPVPPPAQLPTLPEAIELMFRDVISAVTAIEFAISIIL
jgi:hypothetical protein